MAPSFCLFSLLRNLSHSFDNLSLFRPRLFHTAPDHERRRVWCLRIDSGVKEDEKNAVAFTGYHTGRIHSPVTHFLQHVPIISQESGQDRHGTLVGVILRHHVSRKEIRLG